MDYEESIKVHAVCLNFAEATAIVERCLEFHYRLAARLTGASTELPDEQWEIEHTKRENIVKAARWPYGIDTSQDLPFSGDTVNSGFLAVMKVPVLVRKVKTGGK